MSDAFGQIIVSKGLLVPDVVARFHAAGSGLYRGKAEITAGGFLAQAIARLAGFPPAAEGVPFELLVTPIQGGHVWQRRFGTSETRSVLRFDANRCCAIESFGPFRIHMSVDLQGQVLAVAVLQVRVFGVPLPSWIAPKSAALEFVTEAGDFGFDISATLPVIGLLIRYRGAFGFEGGGADDQVEDAFHC